MAELWSQLGSELLQALVAIVVTALTWAAVKAANALMRQAKVAAEAHDGEALWKVLEYAIVWAQDKLASKTGPEKLDWVIGYVQQRTGIDVDEQQAHAVYRALKQAGKLQEKQEVAGNA